MNVHQVLVSASPGDAVTAAAMELQPVFRALGDSGLFARYIHPDLEHAFSFLEDLEIRRGPRPEEDVIFFHASIGEPPVFAFVREAPERLVVNYHNVSPPEPFREYAPDFAGRLEDGRRETAALADKAVLAIADSSFNAADLHDMGYRRVEVAAPVVDLDRLVGQTARTDLDRRAAAATDGPLLLFVGQLLPHKRPDFLVEMFHFLSTYLEPTAGLVLAGAQRLPAYTRVIANQVAELNLAPVVIPGMIGDDELAAWYRRADVFVTASEHEGFCMPLVEAMTFGVPVVARGFGAVAETVGGAGIVLPPDAPPALMAEAVAEVVKDGGLRDALVTRGLSRRHAFDPARSRATVVGHLISALGGAG